MVSEMRLRRWLHEVQRGTRDISSVVTELKRLPTQHFGFARFDTHRRLRRGLPEIILCEGKTPAQLTQLTQRLMRLRETVLLTRLIPSVAVTLQRDVPVLRYDPISRLAYWWPPHARRGGKGMVVVASGGTADLPVAEEAAKTLEVLGSRAVRLFDVGVAGIHRLLESFALLQRARVVVVVAGMEGALASVVAGLVRCPVVAVPTSVGYGASFGGVGALLTMMNSCVPGIGVVNIDNGFGAGYLAHVINTAPVHA